HLFPLYKKGACFRNKTGSRVCAPERIERTRMVTGILLRSNCLNDSAVCCFKIENRHKKSPSSDIIKLP
ncbi:MAG: hypothetical protein K5751_06505, partial [Treponemataceae bacterium]|nr:hypothetical protein [Treponemataceae bacterium]